MSYPYNYGMPQKKKSGMPVWVWILVGVAGIAIVALLLVLLVDFGGADPGVAANSGKTASTGGGPSPPLIPESLFRQQLRRAAVGGMPFQLVSTVPQNAGDIKRTSFLHRPGTTQILIHQIYAGPGNQITYEYWNFASGQKMQALTMSERGILFLTNFSRDGKWLIEPSMEDLRLIDANSGNVRLLPFGEWRQDAVFSLDSKLLLIPMEDGRLVGVDPVSAQQQFAHQIPGMAKVSAICGLAGTQAALANGAGQGVIFDYGRGQVVQTFSFPAGGESIDAVSAGNENSATIILSKTGPVHVDATTGTTTPLRWPEHAIEAFEFVCPGGDVACYAWYGDVVFFDLLSGQELARISAHPESVVQNGVATTHVASVALSQNGQQMVTIGANGALKFWKLKQN